MQYETEQYNVWAYNHTFEITYPTFPTLSGTRVTSYSEFENPITLLDEYDNVIASDIKVVPPNMDWSDNMGLAKVVIPKGKHICIEPKDGYEITNVRFYNRPTKNRISILGKYFTVDFKKVGKG